MMFKIRMECKILFNPTQSVVHFCVYCVQNIRVKAEFPTKYFRVIFASLNGTYYIVEALHKGFTTLTGELQTIHLKVYHLTVQFIRGNLYYQFMHDNE
jgi:hypothetical protein